MRYIEAYRFRWKESDYAGRNNVSLKGLRWQDKNSGGVERNYVLSVMLRVWCKDGAISNMGRGLHT